MGPLSAGTTLRSQDNEAQSMKTVPLIFIAWLAASCPSWAGDDKDRFLEFPFDNDTLTYDLNTLEMIQPGRFTVIGTTIDNPDVMKFKLKVLDTLRKYCTRPEGEYLAPADLFTLGPPDMPVTSIEVESSKKYRTRTVNWFYPYKRFALHTKAGIEERSFIPLHCKSSVIGASDTAKQIMEIRSSITNGSPSKYVFDCRRGMMSFPLLGDDPAKAIMYSVQGISNRDYVRVCYKVTHEWPYLSQSDD